MENTDINPRLQQVKAHWELKNPYESLIASWRQYESVFQITPSYLPADLEASDDSTQEEVPVVAVLSFMNIFVGKKFTLGLNSNNSQSSIYFDHRQVLEMSILIPQDIYVIYLEDEVIKGDFSEEHSEVLRGLLKIAETA